MTATEQTAIDLVHESEFIVAQLSKFKPSPEVDRKLADAHALELCGFLLLNHMAEVVK